MNRVTNTTLISNFAAVYRLDLLRDLAGPLYMPVEVYEEIQEGQLAGYRFYDAIERHIWPFTSDGWLRLVTMTEDELQHFTSLPFNLHQADRVCLSIARQRGWGLLSDDRAVRAHARAWNIPLSGTIGVLLLAIQRGRLHVNEGNSLLRQMIDRANYRSPIANLGDLLPSS